MCGFGHQRGFTILELAISLVLVIVMLSALIPALNSARVSTHRAECAAHQRQLGTAWSAYLADHDRLFPYVPAMPSWRYGGVRFTTISVEPFLDTQRPLSTYVPAGASGVSLFRCPADAGITGPTAGVGTGERTAYRAFGTSYRANAALFDGLLFAVNGLPQPLPRNELVTVPSRLVLLGDPLWYEVRERTGREAAWHGDPDQCNLLFLDGSVKYMKLRTRDQAGPAVFDPKLMRDLLP